MLTHDYIHTIAQLLALLVAVRANLPSPLDKKSMTILSQLMTHLSEPISKGIEGQIRATLLGSFNYLEALVVYGKAVEEGKVNSNEFAGKSPGEVIRMLQQKGLLEVIEEPSNVQHEKAS